MILCALAPLRHIRVFRQPAFLTAVLLVAVSAPSQKASRAAARPSKAPAAGPAAPVENRTAICPGVEHVHKRVPGPLNINALIVDLDAPGVSVRPCMSYDVAVGVESLTSMTLRTGAIAGINGDHWGAYGIPSGMTIIDGEIMTSPRFRSALGIRPDGSPLIGKWTDALFWKAKVIAPNGKMREITSLNSECNEDWLTLYTDRFGINAGGNKFKRTTAVVLNKERKVQEIRTDQPGVAAPPGGTVLVGRDTASAWLVENLEPDALVVLDLKTDPPWQELKHAIGGGPEILRSGFFLDDGLDLFPKGEDFDLPWKKAQYEKRRARSIVGYSRDKSKLFLITVDGGQPKISIGVLPKDAAQIAKELGASNAMLLAGDDAATMVVRNRVVNFPSGRTRKGQPVEALISNGLLVFSK